MAGSSSRLVLLVKDSDPGDIVRRERLYFLTVVVLYAAIAVALMVWSGRRVRRGLTRTEDISRRLRDSQERFRDAVESVSDWIWEIDESRQFTYSSWRAPATIGLDPASVIGKRHEAVFADACDADDPSKQPRHLQFIAKGQPFRDVRFLWHGGGNGPRHLAISGKPVHGEDGAVVGYRGSVSDVTAQVAREESLKTASEQIRRSHQMLIDAIEAVPVAFRLYDRDCRLVLWNSKAREFFPGLDAFTTAGTHLDRAIEALADSGKVSCVEATDNFGTQRATAPRAVSEDLHATLRRYHAGGESFDMTLSDRHHIRTSQHRTADGGRVIVNIDVTAMRTTAAALMEAKRDAEAANLAKSRFLAAASHDLKQPLHAIALMVGSLANLVKDPNQRKLVDEIEASLRATEDMYGSILDISKLDAGVMAPDIANVPLGNLFAILTQEFTPEARQRGLALRFVGTSAVVRTDLSMLARILRNLIGNSLKYTATGRILVGCRRRNGAVAIQVWDTGQGIPESKVDRIFDEFYQVSNPGQALIRGLGLGLSIVDRMAKLLGHAVSVCSRPGAGTVFSVTVPLAAATEAIDENLKRAQR